jgi:hypothetical protein
VRLLESHSSEFRTRHVEASRPGELLNQDTFFWGTLKGLGKIYVQVVVDASCSPAFAKVYTSKMPITACDLLHDRVLPFYEQLSLTVEAVLTDNGREFCGKPRAIPTSCCSRWRASSTGPPRSAHPGPTASSSG